MAGLKALRAKWWMGISTISAKVITFCAFSITYGSIIKLFWNYGLRYSQCILQKYGVYQKIKKKKKKEKCLWG